MKRVFALLCALALSMPAAVPVVAKDHAVGSLDMYAVTVDAARASELITIRASTWQAQKVEANGERHALDRPVAAGAQRAPVREGIDAEPIRDGHGHSSLERARKPRPQAASMSGAPGTSRAGFATSCTTWPRRTPGLVKLVVLGHTIEGREIIALKVTQGAKGQRDGSRPAVLVHVEPARAGMDLGRGQPPPAPLVHRQRQGAATRRSKNLLKSTRALVHHQRQPRRLPIHLRPRAPVAEEPPRHQR